MAIINLLADKRYQKTILNRPHLKNRPKKSFPFRLTNNQQNERELQILENHIIGSQFKHCIYPGEKKIDVGYYKMTLKETKDTNGYYLILALRGGYAAPQTVASVLFLA